MYLCVVYVPRVYVCVYESIIGNDVFGLTTQCSCYCVMCKVGFLDGGIYSLY